MLSLSINILRKAISVWINIIYATASELRLNVFDYEETLNRDWSSRAVVSVWSERRSGRCRVSLIAGVGEGCVEVGLWAEAAPDLHSRLCARSLGARADLDPCKRDASLWDKAVKTWTARDLQETQSWTWWNWPRGKLFVGNDQIHSDPCELERCGGSVS